MQPLMAPILHRPSPCKKSFAVYRVIQDTFVRFLSPFALRLSALHFTEHFTLVPSVERCHATTFPLFSRVVCLYISLAAWLWSGIEEYSSISSLAPILVSTSPGVPSFGSGDPLFNPSRVLGSLGRNPSFIHPSYFPETIFLNSHGDILSSTSIGRWGEIVYVMKKVQALLSSMSAL